MKNFLLPLSLFFVSAFSAQQIADCKKRFDTYLNFRGALNGRVQFTDKAIKLMSAGKPLTVVYEEEIPAISAYLQNSAIKDQENFFRRKGTKKLSATEIDSLQKVSVRLFPVADPAKRLSGYRIALDPGHFATDLNEAQYEQKFLYFQANPGQPSDSVKLFESTLTFNTAQILKKMLEEQGASVFVTRDKANYTSFNCTYTDWSRLHRKRMLDSLSATGQMPPQKYSALLKADNYKLFWEFFRDFDLMNRAIRINAFAPHVTLIIHYNVDEKNVPWKKHSPKNFTMAFIGGAFTADNLDRPEGRLNFWRLLLSDQLNRSQLLAQETVAQFHKQLEVSIAKASDADYLKKNCLVTSSPGVYCRNLALCRKINSPLVYGESLYQDNARESALLMKNDLDLYGIKTNERLRQVAQSYYEGLLEYLKRENDQDRR